MAGAFALLVARARWRTFILARRFRIGREAESDALVLAKKRGYRILGCQVERTFVVVAGTERREVTVRADMMVEKRGRRYVAEVKSGKTAPDPTSRATRRQLFEYAHVFEADGLLLFDMTAGRIREVRFEGLARTAPRAAWPWVVLGAVLGVAAVHWIARWKSFALW